MTLTKIGASLGGGANTIFVTQAGHGLLVGRAVKSTGNGTYGYAKADSALNAEVVGIIIEKSTDTMLIALSGRITVDGAVPVATAGTVLFLSPTSNAGELQTAAVTGNTYVSKPLAIVTYSASEMVMIQQRGEVISTAGITLADESVDSDHYVDGSIDRVHLAANIIDGTKIADDVINSEHYAAASIDNEHLADDAVGADELAANAVVNASVASGAAIEFSKMENLTASRLLVSDGNGDVSVSSVTTTNLTDLTDSGATTLHSHAGGGPSQATQSAIEAETNEDTYAPPDLIKHSRGAAKAWVSYDYGGGTPTIMGSSSGSYNVASLGDDGPGHIQVNFTNNMDGAHYAVLFMANATAPRVAGSTQLAASVDVKAWNSSDTAADLDGSIVVFGKLA
jgi:hypothetical protein